MLPDAASLVTRALSFVCMLQAAGVALFLGAFGSDLARTFDGIRRIGKLTALSGIVLVLMQASLEAARMSGDMAGIADVSLQKFALDSTTGAAATLRVLGLAMIAVVLRRAGHPRVRWGVVGAALVAISFAVTGHTSIHPQRWVLGTLLVFHVLVIAFWFGALTPMYYLSMRAPDACAKVIERFTALATWLVPMIFLAGLGMALIMIPSVAVLGEPYGELLIAKVAGFAALMALAVANKWRLGPALASGEPGGARRFRQACGAELVLIVIVLAVTAMMTSFFSPEH
ncbi:MAG TPA: CopD family protein [Steroidobacteraceae bacterium]|nr:CopD family protein [Steroidobacteraceae bacterium]